MCSDSNMKLTLRSAKGWSTTGWRVGENRDTRKHTFTRTSDTRVSFLIFFTGKVMCTALVVKEQKLTRLQSDCINRRDSGNVQYICWRLITNTPSVRLLWDYAAAALCMRWLLILFSFLFLFLSPLFFLFSLQSQIRQCIVIINIILTPTGIRNAKGSTYL